MSKKLIIVGSGNAALCAGISALEKGATVKILEKANEYLAGGNTKYTAGAMRFVYNNGDELKPLLKDPNDPKLEKTNFGEYSTLSSDGNTAFISNPSYNSNQGVVYVHEKGPVGPNLTYDGKNKLTIGGCNYADTSIVTYYSNTYNLGTAKTMYVKDEGE